MATRPRTSRLLLLLGVPFLVLLSGCLASPSIGRDFHQRVVFIGDSITARWDLDGYFGKGFINKGVESQNAEEIAARFQADVVTLKPDIVVILAGTNDVRSEGDLGLAHDAVAAMVQMARANGIRAVVCTIPPVLARLGSTQAYNLMLTSDPALQVTCDYYRALTDTNGTPIEGALNDDGVHPSILGYVRMAAEINRVLNN
ncbi:MAG TPA: GDSL-type esterase/lipase family protein [Alphaproteobacteria bacterium]|nr:GDSL-type esterase/lipase family protein [Alphaproteobacteria bacterium]